MARTPLGMFSLLMSVLGVVLLGYFVVSSRAATTTTSPSTTIKRAYPYTSMWWQLENTPKINGLASDPNPKRHYDFDYEDITSANISNIKANQGPGVLVTCYFEVGTVAGYGDTTGDGWRDDWKSFPTEGVASTAPDGWGDERWIDIMNPTVRQIMAGRMDVARNKGCDGIEPDWLDNYTYTQAQYDSGNKIHPPTLAQELDYMKFLADTAHAKGLMIALKNVPTLADDRFDDGRIVADVYDWALAEECMFTYKETACATLKEFINRNKNVTAVEYNDQISETTFKTGANYCAKYNTWNFDGILYDRRSGSSPTLTGNYRVACRTGAGETLPPTTSTTTPAPTTTMTSTVTTTVSTTTTPPTATSTTVLPTTTDIFPSPWPAGTYDDNKFFLAGTWSPISNSGDYNGSESRSNTAGSTATINFTGTSISLYGVQTPSSGKLSYSINGGTPTEVSLYGASRVNQYRFITIGALKAATNHNLVIKVLGTKDSASSGTNISLDKFEIVNTPCVPGDKKNPC